MAKAKQVGTPHSPQLVFGSFLKISIPVRAISRSFVKTVMSVGVSVSDKINIFY